MEATDEAFVILDDEEVLSRGQRDNGQQEIARRIRSFRDTYRGNFQLPSQPRSLDHDDEIEELANQLSEVIDLTDEDPGPDDRRSRTRPLRNPDPPAGVRIDRYLHHGQVFIKGKTVEMPPMKHLFNATFLHITMIIQDPAGEVLLRGLPLTRSRNMGGQLPRLRNELCQVLQIDGDDDRPDEVQAAVEIKAADALCKRNLVFTNHTFPRQRDERLPASRERDNEDIEEHGLLVCRWRYRSIYHSSVARTRGRAPRAYAIEYLHAGERLIKDRNRANDTHRRNIWRGGVVRGGSHHPAHGDRIVVEIDGQPDPAPTHPGSKYSFIDAFCGAGGASLGAQMAGAYVTVGVDHDKHACKTWRANFPEARNLEMDMFDFIARFDDAGIGLPNVRSDLLHLSPPCQFWSPAHTVRGKNDEANIASLFACHELVLKIRPRIFTLEQTFGLLFPQFQDYFYSLIRGFTSHGYSVRWEVVNLMSWGLPATRRRLIILGSCPGEPLPTLPAATHSEHVLRQREGMKPPVTVKEALRDWQRTTVDKLSKKIRCCREPWNPYQPLARAITCNGGGNYHYTGKRQFYLRELAVLQGFPTKYFFEPVGVKQQVGNAFPPTAVKVLYRHLINHLRARDGLPAQRDRDGQDGNEWAGAESFPGRDDPLEASSDEDERESIQIEPQPRGMPCIDAQQQRPSPRPIFINLEENETIDLTL